MQSAPSPAAGLAIFRLARSFGHGWTYHLEESLFQENGWAAAIAAVVLRMEAVEQETGYHEGLRPSTEHVSASGRYAWNWNSDDTITLSINRPSGAAVVAEFDPAEGTATVFVTALAEERHEQYMAEELLQPLSATVLWTDRPPCIEVHTPAPRLSVRATRDPVAFALAAWG